MRNGRYVSDVGDAKTGGLETTQSRLTSSSRAIHENRDSSHAVVGRDTSTIFRCDLGRKRGALSCTTETSFAGGRPTYDTAHGIRDGDDSVVKGALHVGMSVRDVPLAGLLFPNDFFSLFRFFGFRSFCYGLLGLSTHSITPLLGNLELFAHRNRFAGPFAGPGVRVGPLTADRKATPVPETTIGAEIHQPFNVLVDDPSELTFHSEILFQMVADLGDFVFAELIGFLIGVDVDSFQDLNRAAARDPVDVGQTHFNSFVPGEVNSRDACHV